MIRIKGFSEDLSACPLLSAVCVCVNVCVLVCSQVLTSSFPEMGFSWMGELG